MNKDKDKINISYIMYLLNEIILQLEEIKQDEDSCNEGSLTDYEYFKLIHKFNIIFKELIKDE